MQPRLEATLADFVPALRFLSPDRVDRHLGHPDLPPAWWTSVPISRAVEAIGAEELPQRLADLAYEDLRHLRLGDLLPAAWLARNDFRLSQWPDGVRTNVLVRTPDWADLLTATVQEIGDWTQVGTSTVRPVIAQLFAEVLGLLPAEEIAARSAAFQAVAAPPAEAAPEADPEVAEPPQPEASQDSPAASGSPADAGAAEPAEAAAPAAPASRGIRISKRHVPADVPGTEPEPVPAPLPVPVAEPEVPALDDSGLGPVSDLLEAIEDELRPVSMPAPPTGDLGAVVRWLAEEAPDVPLMSELARVTLETVSVVGIEGAPPEVRTAVLRLTSLVPETLLPEGLDVSEEAFAVPGADLEDPYDAPEMTAILGAVRPEAPEALPAAGEPGALPAGPAVSPDDLTVLAMPAVVPGSRARRGLGEPDEHDAYDDPYGAADEDRAEDTGSPASPKSIDIFYERPLDDDAETADPEDTEDARDAEDASRPGAVDAFGEVPPATREDLPAAAPEPAAAEAPEAESVDAFGEIPPYTRDDIPVQTRSQAPDAEATVFEPAGGSLPSWIKGGGAKAGSPDDLATVEVGSGAAAEDSGPGDAAPADPARAAAAAASAAAAAAAARAVAPADSPADSPADAGPVIPPRPT
ncbi:hypothetical protein, partial [Yinghuangia soli]|nr:hypothetical protein [Yinghuangia soli]